MNIDLLFPIFEQNDDFFKKLFNSKFYNQNDKLTYYFYCNENISLDFLKEFPKEQKFVIRQTKDKFNINDVFLDYLKLDSSCDVLLLGDTKVAGLNKLFKKCLEKANEGVNIVHIKPKKNKFKQFFLNITEKVLNFFISIFTNKKDKFNILSLGLIDNKILSVLKTLPHKACLLKNTNMFYGYSGRTLFIDEKTSHYKEKFWQKTKSSKIVIPSFCINLLSILGIIFGAIYSKIYLLSISTFLLLTTLSCVVLFGAKHIIDIRTKPLGATFIDKKD